MRGFVIFLLTFTVFFGSKSAHAQTVDFGTNASEYANDGECDDRRFFGDGMATDLDRDDTGADTNDCEKLYRAKKIQLWIQADAKAATSHSNIDFGDNSSEWANDGECDDIRFEGPGTADMTSIDDVREDATDCIKMHRLGRIFLRNYK